MNGLFIGEIERIEAVGTSVLRLHWVGDSPEVQYNYSDGVTVVRDGVKMSLSAHELCSGDKVLSHTPYSAYIEHDLF